MARVVTYSDDLRPHFERLNREWIESYFELEEADREVFRDPAAAIVAPGGQIFFVLEGDAVVGTCALAPHGAGELELAKMAVDPSAQGRGYGDLLMGAAVDFARGMGARRIVLESNTRLGRALRLYAKHGFREVPLDPDGRYARVDIMMELRLDR